MTFDELLVQVMELLQRQGRVSYGALKRQFTLADDYLQDLKDELIDAQRVAADEDGKVLVWTGEGARQEPGNRRIGESKKAQTTSSDVRRRTPDARPTDGERRQLTVMFCDLVGSTELSTQLDPEEWREVVRAYQETCAEVISRYKGHIAQYLGDGLLVYFGYPVAHEDDAQRAAHTGLGIVKAIPALPLPRTVRLPQPLQVRIGIHTGPVVVGEMGGGDKRELLALGQTPNVAARLQGLAAPDTVVISAATYRLTQGFFTCQDLGLHTVKGVPTPTQVYQVVGESGVRSRLEVASTRGLTPLVGRDEEMGLLGKRWEQAKAGEGQVVLLSGEPGIGKSRLVQVVKERVAAEGSTRIEFRCSPYYQNTAWYPVIEHLQRFWQFGREEAAATKLAKVEHGLSGYRLSRQEVVPLFAVLLSLPHPEGYPPLTLSPPKQKQKTQEVLVSWLMEEAEKRAVYCVWEDLHWADPSSLELLGLLIDQAALARLLLMLTFRSEFTPPWAARSHLTPLTLSRLPRTQAEEMVEKVTDGKALPAEVVNQIVSKTDGVPLFVEELTKMVLESGTEVGARRAVPLSLGIPTTLQDALMARLDRLGLAKEIAQVGATLGREFSYELLQAVSPIDDASLQQALVKLVEAEVLYPRGLPPQARYLFKHALIQDAAYQSLLKSKRQQYHQQIAHVLEEWSAETKETQPELLAHHYSAAGLIAQAIPYWQKAGQRAIQRSAHAEAVAHFTKGLELLKTLPETPDRIQQELTLQTALSSALVVTKGLGAHEVRKAYDDALELCQRAGETPQRGPVLIGLSAYYLQQEEMRIASDLAEQCLALAERQQDSSLIVAACRILVNASYWSGNPMLAHEYCERGMARYDPLQHRSLALAYGFDPAVSCLGVGAWALWYLGYPDQALKRSQAALALAHEVNHPYTLAWALNAASWTHCYRREGQAACTLADEAIALSTTQDFPHWLAMGLMMRGQALIELGQWEEGIAQMRQGIEAYRATGAVLGTRGHNFAELGKGYGGQGQSEEGLQMITEALAGVNQVRNYEAEMYRLKGELALQQFGVRSPEFGVSNPQPLTPKPKPKRVFSRL